MVALVGGEDNDGGNDWNARCENEAAGDFDENDQGDDLERGDQRKVHRVGRYPHRHHYRYYYYYHHHYHRRYYYYYCHRIYRTR